MLNKMSRPSKAIVTLLAGVVAMTGLGLESALAAPKAQKAPAAATQAAPSSDATDFSGRRRAYRYNNDAAAIGTFLAIAGTVAAVAASRRHRHRPYAYGGYPGYYAPRYYAPQPYYGGYAPYGYYGRRW